jgi:flagellar hook assembly protein FlgD
LSALSFVLATSTSVRVDIHDVRGALVRRLLPERQMPVGSHTVIWDGLTDGGRRANSGLYFVHVQAGSAEATTRLVLTR